MAGALKKVACLVLALALVAAPMAAEAAVTCGQVASSMAPCVGYLTRGGFLPPQCCAGVRNLNGIARTTPDRQAACRCLQNAARGIRGLNPNLASGLPGRCGVNIPYKISLATNCNTVR